MIEVAPTTAVMLYLGGALFFILGFWGLHHLKGRRTEKRTAEERFAACRYCGCGFLRPPDARVAKCPRCGSFI